MSEEGSVPGGAGAGRGGRVALEYQAVDVAGKRPRWVYGVMAIYGLLLVGMLLLPVVMGFMVDVPFGVFVFAAVGGILFLGLSLMVIPVGAKLRRPVTKRTIWIPIAGSSVLVALLMYAMLAAVDDAYGVYNAPNWALLVGATVTCWLFWVVMLVAMASARGPQRAGTWLYRMLLTGNLLELLVAVPMHLVARRRTECCAGMASAMAIGLGAVMAVVLIGPAMFWLYYRRWDRVRQKRG